jgi:hypothetical protein
MHPTQQLLFSLALLIVAVLLLNLLAMAFLLFSARVAVALVMTLVTALVVLMVVLVRLDERIQPVDLLRRRIPAPAMHAMRHLLLLLCFLLVAMVLLASAVALRCKLVVLALDELHTPAIGGKLDMRPSNILPDDSSHQHHQKQNQQHTHPEQKVVVVHDQTP